MWNKVSILISLILVNAVTANQYTVVGSQHIRPNSVYNVAVSAFDAPEPARFHVCLRNGGDFELAHNVTVAPWTTQLVAFELGSLPPPPAGLGYTLAATKRHGVHFRQEIPVRVLAKRFSILSQSDRTLYKPGDLIRFRALVIDADTRPYQLDGSLSVYLQNANQQRVKQWRNQSTEAGWFRAEYRLSSEPSYGDWRLVFEADGERREHRIEVANYVLPAFEVHIETAKEVPYAQGRIVANFRGRYSVGAGYVRGTATVTLETRGRSMGVGSILAPKAIDVQGPKGTVSYELADDLGLRRGGLHQLRLHVTLVERHTGREAQASVDIDVYQKKYHIEHVDAAERFYYEGRPLQIRLRVTRYDGAPMRYERIEVMYSAVFCPRNEMQHQSYLLDGDGYADVVLDFPVKETGFFVLTKFQDIREFFGYYRMRYEDEYSQYSDYSYHLPPPYYPVQIRPTANVSPEFQVTATSANSSVGDTVTLKLQSRQSLNYYTYHLVGRGNILDARTVKTDNPALKNYEIKFLATSEMQPSVKILVHTVRFDQSVKVTSTTVTVRPSPWNSISLEARPKSTKPGASIQLKITTNSNSSVGLLAVDRSVLMLPNNHKFKLADIVDSMKGYDSEHARYAFTEVPSYFGSHNSLDIKQMGLYMLTTMQVHSNENQYGEMYAIGANQYSRAPSAIYQAASGPGIMLGHGASTSNFASNSPYVPANVASNSDNSPAIRNNFPESWIWDIVPVESGVANITYVVPDSITSWSISAIALSRDKGIALTEESTSVQVIKPFFVSVSLPNSMKLGEILSIPIVVFNYLTVAVDADVVLHNDNDDFEFVEFCNTSAKINILHVEAQDSASRTVTIRPLKVGALTVKVSAVSAWAGDKIELILLVKSDGLPQKSTEPLFIDLREVNQLVRNLSVVIPEQSVPHSTYLEVSVIGDIMGPTIDNLDHLLQLPSGYGQRDLMFLVSNIVILDYLKSVNRLSQKLEETSLQHIEMGYQQQLNYQNRDGSFSEFSDFHPAGSIWLTAYVARFFQRAIQHTDIIEDRIIRNALVFLRDAQAKDGSFTENIHIASATGRFSTTAHVLLAFVENMHAFPEFAGVIGNATDYLAQNLEAVGEDMFALAIGTYALQLVGPEGARNESIRRLNAHAFEEGDYKYWEMRSSWSYGYGYKTNTQLTSYALLANIEAGSDEDIVPIVRWLVAQRNADGGFATEQDTIVGLQALVRLGTHFFSDPDVQLKITYAGGEAQFVVNAENAMILQQLQLPDAASEISVSANGTGWSFLTLSHVHHTNITIDESSPFRLSYEEINSTYKNLLVMRVCAGFNDTAGMRTVVLEVELPSGYVYDKNSLPALQSSQSVMKVQLKYGDSLVVMYLRSLDIEPICLTIRAVRQFWVSNLKSGSLSAYEYYNNARRSSVRLDFENRGKSDVCEYES